MYLKGMQLLLSNKVHESKGNSCTTTDNWGLEVILDIPNLEFTSSVLMVTLLAHSLKVAKHLIMWSYEGDSASTAIVFGIVLIMLHDRAPRYRP